MPGGGPAERLLAALALTAVLTGCSGKPNPTPADNASRGAPRGEAELPVHRGRCPVTTPGGKVPTTEPAFNYGNDSLAVVLWAKGRLVAGRLPDGSSYAEIRPDGSIVAKLGWWRAVEGRLSIEGERLDARAPPLRADIPAGYGPSGLQVSSITFPTRGCWKVVGTVGRSSLTFVVLVRKR